MGPSTASEEMLQGLGAFGVTGEHGRLRQAGPRPKGRTTPNASSFRGRAQTPAARHNAAVPGRM